MSMKEYGTKDGSTIVWYAGQPTAEREGATWSYRYKGWCKRSLVFSLIPANDTAITDAAFAGIDITGVTTTSLKLNGVSLSPNSSPEKMDVEFIFKYTNIKTGSWGGHFNGEIEQRSETTVRDVPVNVVYQQEAGLGSDLEIQARAAAEAEVDSIPVPGLKYFYSLYTTSFVWSEPSLIAVSGISIAEVGAPTGLVVTGEAPATTPTPGFWILQGKSVENVGAGMVKVSEEWEYSPVSWNIVPGEPPIEEL
jgi:hypothetical protein